MNATPIKLKSGAWGVRVNCGDLAVREGDTVTVSAKSGKTWTSIVEAVVWRGNGFAICSTKASARGRGATTHSSSRGGSFGSRYCGGICPVGGFRCNAKNGPCHDCL